MPLPADSYYTFGFGEQNAGWFAVHRGNGTVSMNAVFMMQGQRLENPFTYTIRDGVITQVRFADEAWQAVPAYAWPSSAYEPLVLTIADGIEHDYVSFNEGDSTTAVLRLRRRGDLVEEFQGEKPRRRFWLRDGQIVKIDWGGGAVSELRESLQAAKAGSSLD